MGERERERACSSVHGLVSKWAGRPAPPWPDRNVLVSPLGCCCTVRVLGESGLQSESRESTLPAITGRLPAEEMDTRTTRPEVSSWKTPFQIPLRLMSTMCVGVR